jgi:hypothetical protein
LHHRIVALFLGLERSGENRASSSAWYASVVY